MGEIIYKDEAYAILGACFEVYNDKGCGFLEAVYQECLVIEFGLRGLPCVPREKRKLNYKGRILETLYEPDFRCYEKIILELKAVSKLADQHQAQVHNYLNWLSAGSAGEFRLGRQTGIRTDRPVTTTKKTKNFNHE